MPVVRKTVLLSLRMVLAKFSFVQSPTAVKYWRQQYLISDIQARYKSRIVATKIEPIYGVLGSTIQKLREARKMTQAQLGRSLTPQSTRASIANIEQGKQRVLVHTFVQLAKALESDMKDLLPASEPAPPSPSVHDVERELSRKLNLATPQLKKLARATSPMTGSRRVKE